MLQNIKKLSNRSADMMGISASVLCMIHCLAFPVMISLGYMVKYSDTHDHDHDHEHFHWHWMDYFFIALAIWAVYNAAKNTHSKRIKIALWIAVIIFSIAILLHEWNPVMIAVSIAASLALIIIHIINWKYHKNCKIVGE
jgi:cell division protein FtsW (lipid II flippase)